ncbi:interferon alpha/beta receptor 2-like isoform X2 [Microtus pennsylvanicus]|uniref:interferon alpha/beta receptor 2-like isoform X2 n=1 Tax=Microtus pennsylvanicus TaxID=10058 RepID=UPI003F6AFFEB
MQLSRCESRGRTYRLTRMLSNRAFSTVSFCNLCLALCMILQFGSPSAFVAATEETYEKVTEYPEESCTVNLILRNFRLVVSLELENKSLPPTHFTFWSTMMSETEAPKVLENCRNITEPSCDVTDKWNGAHETYVLIIVIYRGDSMPSYCDSSVMDIDIRPEPPEFEIIGFVDHINVTVKFPPVTPKIYGESIWKVLGSKSFFIEERAGKNMKMHNPKMDNTTGNFTYVLRDLLPKTNYCVSVYFKAAKMEDTIKSPFKCTLLPPGQEAGLSESTTVGIIAVCFITMSTISFIILLKRIGCICLKNSFPNALNLHNILYWIFPEVPPSEAVDKLEIIPTNKKKKVWNYDYGDESDSDEEEVPKASATGYTTHGLMGRLPHPASDSSANPQEAQLEEDSAAEESDEAGARAGAMAEHPTEAEVGSGLRPSEDPSSPYEKKERGIQDSFPGDDSSSVNGPGDKVIFNVNLNSVFLRALHDDPEEASEVLSLAEDTGHLDEAPHRTESGLLTAGSDSTQLPQPGISSQVLWTENESSETTDSSDSDADLGDGYIMR